MGTAAAILNSSAKGASGIVANPQLARAVIPRKAHLAREVIRSSIPSVVLQYNQEVSASKVAGRHPPFARLRLVSAPAVQAAYCSNTSAPTATRVTPKITDPIV